MPIALSHDNFEQEITKSSKPTVIDIYAEPWCGACKLMEPIFNELEQEFGTDYKFAKLNVDHARELSIQMGVTAVPTFVFFSNGKIIAKKTGYMSKEDLAAEIIEHLG